MDVFLITKVILESVWPFLVFDVVTLTGHFVRFCKLSALFITDSDNQFFFRNYRRSTSEEFPVTRRCGPICHVQGCVLALTNPIPRLVPSSSSFVSYPEFTMLIDCDGK